MTVTTTEIDPTGYTAIDATWQFDLAFYRDIGVDLKPLEDASHEGAMPRMRRAAGLTLRITSSETASHDQVRRAERLLGMSHSYVRRLMHEAAIHVDFKAVEADHPAIGAWQERNEHSEKPDTRDVTGLLKNIDRIHIGLVRPKMPAIDPEHAKAKFYPVTKPNTNYYDSPLEVADQLVLARVGVWYDI